MAESENDLQENVTKLNRVLEAFNMKISISKTKVMAMEGKYNRRAKIVIKDQIIEQVNNFKYLGCNLSIFNLNQDLDNNVIKYNAINGCINRYLGNSMRKEVKLRLHNVVSKPMLLYSSETWIMREKDKNKIESSEMRFLRRLQGVSLRDRVRSADIRNELGLERSIVEEIVQYQNNWKEHVNRMSSDRLPKQALFYNPKGKRDIGRPRTRWKDQFQ